MQWEYAMAGKRTDKLINGFCRRLRWQERKLENA